MDIGSHEWRLGSWLLAPALLVQVTLLMTSLSLGCQGGRSLNPAERREIEAVIERQRLAWNRGDLAGYMEGYAHTPGLLFTSGGKIRRGWDETLAAYQKRYGGDRAGMGHLDFELLEVAPVGAGAAVVLGRWRLGETAQAGSGVFSLVVEQRPEGWRIVHDHTSVDRVPGDPQAGDRPTNPKNGP